MTNNPQFVIVYQSSAHYEVMHLSSNGECYTSIAMCSSLSNAQYLLRALNEYVGEVRSGRL